MRYESELVKNNHIIKFPDYTDLKIEAVHVFLIVFLLIFGIIGIRTALKSSLPTTKATVMIIGSIIVAGFVAIAIYTGQVR